MSIPTLLRDLCLLDGVSGAEDEVRDYIIRKVTPYAEEVRVDPLGSVLVLRKGKKHIDTAVLLSAHMDEVGFIIKDITPEGLLTFHSLGGVDRRVVIGKRVKVGPKKLPGIIPIKAHHLVSKEEEAIVPKLEDLYIDIGAGTKEEAARLVSIGDVCSFDSDFVEFGGGFVKAKAIDDRIGCAVMLQLIEEGPPVDAWFSFVVQEEVGLRGSTAASFALKPEIALILEGTTAADIPNVEAGRRACSPGKGAVLPFMDNSAIYDKPLLEDLRRIADKRGIRWQHKNVVAGGTDAGSIQKSRAGVRVAAISAAVRCIHSPVCVAAAADFEDILKLARAYLESL
jgi:endoglucanase